ncbi:MAG: hypothetical protein LBV18_05350 [Alistipes sp.]|jgi:hypothetical protein|nr:hypothetical protein [Alistipes sp.]
MKKLLSLSFLLAGTLAGSLIGCAPLEEPMPTPNNEAETRGRTENHGNKDDNGGNGGGPNGIPDHIEGLCDGSCDWGFVPDDWLPGGNGELHHVDDHGDPFQPFPTGPFNIHEMDEDFPMIETDWNMGDPFFEQHFLINYPEIYSAVLSVAQFFAYHEQPAASKFGVNSSWGMLKSHDFGYPTNDPGVLQIREDMMAIIDQIYEGLTETAGNSMADCIAGYIKSQANIHYYGAKAELYEALSYYDLYDLEVNLLTYLDRGDPIIMTRDGRTFIIDGHTIGSQISGGFLNFYLLLHFYMPFPNDPSAVYNADTINWNGTAKMVTYTGLSGVFPNIPRQAADTVATFNPGLRPTYPIHIQP